jgi:putative FmdB family regulatory protein
MPLYEYKCTACQKLVEKIQKFSDPEITVCPHCGGALERVVSAPAIAFKGGGWYADGYASAKPAASSSSESNGSSEGTKSSSGTSASAPAAAPAASSATPAATPSK